MEHDAKNAALELEIASLKKQIAEAYRNPRAIHILSSEALPR
jgi:hypothetical protein